MEKLLSAKIGTKITYRRGQLPNLWTPDKLIKTISNFGDAKVLEDFCPKKNVKKREFGNWNLMP